MLEQSTDGACRQVEGGSGERRPPTRVCSSRGQGRRDDGLPDNRGVRDAVYWSGIIGNGILGLIRILSPMAICGLIFAGRGSNNQELTASRTLSNSHVRQPPHLSCHRPYMGKDTGDGQLKCG